MSASALDTLLISLQLTDSAFPSGLYTLSHGLEGFLQAKQVDRESMPELLADLLRHSVGPADATALALANRAAAAGDWAALVEVDQRLFASKLNRELRLAATRTGRQMLDTARLALGGEALDRYAELVVAKRSPGCQAVAAGVAYAAGGVAAEQAVASDLFAFAVSFVSAALRLRLTDHRRAQTTLRSIAPVIKEVTGAALHRELADLGGCVPIADAMSGRHERAEARMFAS
ncbi:urease accessory protein [Kitasatospora sp. NBC_01287]|uniref:urease accessory protein UreF n=1 Tax=Kitasatospora sp. NBC_01287 TaxID=2903573 RepID=UPI002258B719|nr:urease accessory UreF family protein [Kitasatospora sp. NBC_01287]MCX4744969.1 urease accessory protein [Kitasatospora sp. NBC_01287]